MLVNKLARNIVLNTRILNRFGGGHHHVYDWRDDHSKNPDFYQDPRMHGVRPASSFVTPYQTDEKLSFSYSHPPEYDQKNLKTNFTGYYFVGQYKNDPQVPQTDYIADAAHEYDYESQDLDYQPQSFQSQHFRKQGPLWIWMLASTIPIWFIGNQLFFQLWPDVDNWRYQRPPPLNYPDDDETPDNEYLKMFKSTAHKDLYDAGVVSQPFFTVVDGKKVYTRWSGVNQPIQPI